MDTAGWAESWEVLRKRIIEGFTAIAEDLERSGGGNAIVVSHGMTIATFAWLIDPSVEHPSLDNGSVTVVAYENGKFTLEALGDMTYRQVGRETIEKMVKITIQVAVRRKANQLVLVISSVLIAVLLVAAGLYSVFGVSRTVQQTNGSSVMKSSKQATDTTQSKGCKGTT